MSSAQAAPLDLSSLADRYDVVAELGRGQRARTYIARRRDVKRRSDDAEVLVSIVSTPEGDERNALSHLAADTNLLCSLSHAALLPVLDGRWVGDDAFAVITERPGWPTLAQALLRGEELTNPRIAAILQQVNGLLSWARANKVVHRRITPNTLWLEPSTDRVVATFTVRPIGVTGVGDVREQDVRTIASLARAMLARTPDAGEAGDWSLLELRPDLPRRVADRTDALLRATHGDALGEDVTDFIACIATADVLQAAEVDASHMQAVLLDERLDEQARWEAERQSYEDRMADLTAQVAAEREEMQRTLATERETMERTLAAEREAMRTTLASERATLESEREAMREMLEGQRAEMLQTIARERQALDDALAEDRAATSAMLAAEQARMAAERSALEDEIAAEREALAARQAELERAAEETRARLEADRAGMERAFAAQRERDAADRAARDKELALAQQLLSRDRTELERSITAQRADVARSAAEERARLSDEKRAVEAQLAALTTERERLEAELAQMQAERARLFDERRDFERERATLEGRVRELEAAGGGQREPGGATPAAGEQEPQPAAERGKQEASASPLPPSASRPVEREVPVPRAFADVPIDGAPAADPPSAASRARVEGSVPLWAATTGDDDFVMDEAERRRSRRGHVAAIASGVAVVGLLAAAAAGIGTRDDEPRPERVQAAASRPAPRATLDSAAGSVVPRPASTAAGVPGRGAVPSVVPVPPWRTAAPAPAPMRRDGDRGDRTPAAPTGTRPSTVRGGESLLRPTAERRPTSTTVAGTTTSAARRDTAQPLPLSIGIDSLLRRDSLRPRPDSIRPDSARSR